MAQATYSVTTAGTGLNKLWKKVQGKLQKGAQFMTEEFEAFNQFRNFDVNWSAREITFPIDITDDDGVASIPEGGVEARPSSPNAQEAQITWINMNARFTVSRTAEYIDKLDPDAELENQIKYQGLKKLQAVGRAVGDYIWGTSTGYLAQTTTIATQASGTYNLENLYGSSTYPGTASTTLDTNNANLIADKFRPAVSSVGGTWVALIRSGALVTNAIGQVTAVSAAGTVPATITVTWNGTVTSASGDYIVKANSIENTTVAGTDYLNGATGLYDMAYTTTVHNLSGSSVPRWNPALTDSSGGRFSGVRLHKGRDVMFNIGGGKMDLMFIEQGVYRDMVALQQTAVRFNDPYDLDLDGDVKAKGIGWFKTRRVLPGTVIGTNRNSIYRMTLLEKPSGQPAWGDGYKLQDSNGFVFPMDYPWNMVITNRSNMIVWNTLQSQ